MATDVTSSHNEFINNLSAIDDALHQARTQLGALTDAASAVNETLDEQNEAYSLHEVPGVGRYAILRKTGWLALIDVIRDRDANIDFSSNMYPGFDAVIGEHFKSPYLLDPLNDNYESYRCLRENIAAVRNFLMETYYVNTPAGMTPDKAEQAMQEIAKFVGEGLSNNYKFMGLVANHDPNKPFISIREACAPGGAGAQYLYEKILAMHRQSSWMRPFSAVIALFGGKAAPNWMLPAAASTEFTNLFAEDIVDTHGPQAGGPRPEQIEAGIATVDQLEAARQQALDRQRVNAAASDLDSIANHLLFSASNMQNVAQLSEPVRRDAIEIAKDILRKLKVSLGNANIMDGLKLPPLDDLATFGGIKGVAMVYERLLGHSRGLDPSIMQHPSIMAATRAIGQMGYLAKLEALRMARIAGNTDLAQNLSGQLARIPEVYATASEATFGGLLNKVERGIETLMSRMQTISGPGAHVGFSPGKEIGSSINAAPTAGMAQQITLQQQQQTVQRTTQQLASEAANLQAQANRMQAQAQQRANEATRTQQGTTMRTLTRQNALRIAQRNSSSSSTSPTNPNNQAQRQQALRNNALRQAREDHDEQEMLFKQRQLEIQRQQQAAKKAAAKATIQKLDPKMLQGMQNATDTRGLTGAPVNPAPRRNMYGQRIDRPTTGTPVRPATTVQPAQATLQPNNGTKAPEDDINNPNRPPHGPRGNGGRGI